MQFHISLTPEQIVYIGIPLIYLVGVFIVSCIEQCLDNTPEDMKYLTSIMWPIMIPILVILVIVCVPIYLSKKLFGKVS